MTLADPRFDSTRGIEAAVTPQGSLQVSPRAEPDGPIAAAAVDSWIAAGPELVVYQALDECSVLASRRLPRSPL